MDASQSNDSYGPPNTLNNACGDQAHGFGNSRNTGPGRDVTVFRHWEGRYVTLNNSNNASLNENLSANYGPPNTINNAYGNQAHGSGNSRNTVFNKGPGRDDTVFLRRCLVDQSVNSDLNLVERETDTIEPLQVSTFYFVFDLSKNI